MVYFGAQGNEDSAPGGVGEDPAPGRFGGEPHAQGFGAPAALRVFGSFNLAMLRILRQVALVRLLRQVVLVLRLLLEILVVSRLATLLLGLLRVVLVLRQPLVELQRLQWLWLKTFVKCREVIALLQSKQMRSSLLVERSFMSTVQSCAVVSPASPLLLHQERGI